MINKEYIGLIQIYQAEAFTTVANQICKYRKGIFLSSAVLQGFFLSLDTPKTFIAKSFHFECCDLRRN